MSSSPPTNVVNSLKLVREELLATVDVAAKDLEAFFSNTADGHKLQEGVEGLKQVAGTLAMLQMNGPQCLANALLAVTQDITPGEDAVDEAQVQSLTSGFYMLPRYLEFIENTKTDHPELLLPQINELRASVGEPPLPDSNFFSVPQYPKSMAPSGLVSANDSLTGDRDNMAVRLRHMYQIGLVALLQNKPIKPPLKMMSFALERLANLYRGEAISTLCYTASVALGLAQQGRTELTKPRKAALVNLEKTLRRMIKIDPQGASTLLPRPLTKEYVYWCAISPVEASQKPEVDALLALFGVSRPSYTLQQLREEAEILGGPSINTIESVISVFEEEVESAKRMLELAAEAQSSGELGELEALLAKLSEILAIIGLNASSQRLKEQVETVAEVRSAGGEPDRDKLSQVADALLKIENSVAKFKKQAGYRAVDDNLSESDIANHQLAEAELIVLQEAENGLTLVKRALSAFAESNYDRAHIANVTKTLATIKGGMLLMHKNRCVEVLAKAEQFIDQGLMTEEHPSVLQQLLETFADCVISLEYYVTALQSDKNTDDGILKIAEESITALGLDQ
ncbi:hypothetical protein [Halioxenophilus aromaticivorans]|uniref:Type IV pilus/biofilm regulator FimL n=1 Tax=Halioxenophilus aromaticivorans TaxID=1306992 RepID=A0AAV3TYC1_9ALTE